MFEEVPFETSISTYVPIVVDNNLDVLIIGLMYRYLILSVAVQAIVLAEEIHSPDDSLSKEYIKQMMVKTATPIHDSWFSQDKFLHFSASAAISGLTYHLYVCRLGRDEKQGKVFSVSLTALIGVGKEIYDKHKKGHFSWKDLVWDGIGLTVGYFMFVH